MRGTPRSKGRALIAGAAAFALSISLATQANADQAQNAYYYSHWKFAGAHSGYWNVDQQMRIERKARATYWAQVWNWVGSSDGGYLGLQTNGTRFNGTPGDTAIFSLWNANAASGPSCGQFDGEGNGYSCRRAYPISTSPYYRYRVWRLDADSGGQWWGAWIQNLATGRDTYIGAIRVASARRTMTNVQNFVEYYGKAVPCNRVPVSKVVWTQPAANSQGGGYYQYGSSYQATPTDKGACTGGSATPVTLPATKGVRVILGGPTGMRMGDDADPWRASEPRHLAAQQPTRAT